MSYDEEQQEVEIIKSELVKELRQKLVSLLGNSEGEAERLLKNFCDNVSCRFMEAAKEIVGKLVTHHWQKWLTEKGDELLRAHFERALQDEVIVSEKETYVHKKCQEVVLSRMKQFFSDNYRERDKRKDIVNNTIDEVISKCVNAKVDEAIEELKEETIAKFNKEAMKRMMQGMAKEIAGDKKLLALMTE